MKAINLKFVSTSILLFSTFSTHGIFAGAPIRPDDPYNGPMSYSIMQIESVAPITYDIIGSNLAVCFNSKIGTATVSIEDQYGNVVYQSIANTNTQSVLYIPVQDMEVGSYILKVTSANTNFVGYFQL